LPWYELSELIDADSQGKNFNEFAQLLTLKVLLMQANANMMQMQDRYRLDIADESLNESPDSLYVIDGFMGNTRRAADKTLSGGEKFMASLALALGLSDLSAGKIQLSNLFIDEGFGSLDPDTLDKAIGILESLQQERSRSIGIISHVSELKERIQVQIQILPGPNGHSKIQFQPPLLTH
jgi:exonuclease SbcC